MAKQVSATPNATATRLTRRRQGEARTGGGGGDGGRGGDGSGRFGMGGSVAAQVQPPMGSGRSRAARTPPPADNASMSKATVVDGPQKSLRLAAFGAFGYTIL